MNILCSLWGRNWISVYSYYLEGFMVSEVVNCPKSRQSKTGRNFNFATDLKLILQQTEVLQYVWSAYRLVSYQFYSCFGQLLPFRSKIKITGTRRVSTLWRNHTHKWSTYSTWQRSELQGGASEERNILLSTEVINETCIVSRLIMDIVRNIERLSDQGNQVGCTCRRHGEDEKFLHIWAEGSSRQTALQGVDVIEH